MGAVSEGGRGLAGFFEAAFGELGAVGEQGHLVLVDLEETSVDPRSGDRSVVMDRHCTCCQCSHRRLVVREERAELARRPDPQNMWIWRAAYPEAFRGAVAPAARAQGLDPEYLWAIMRQESGYEPEAVSYADAIGLLQLIPQTASRVAEGLGVPFVREMLFDPAWNARLAAQYNARLRRAHGVPLAFAAYNGGGHRVTAWLRDRAPMDLDHFVERMPITQTKNYARRVTSHYARYVYLREDDGQWPFELPRRVEP